MTSRLFDFSASQRALSNRNFAIFTAGNVVSLTGTWIQRLAQGWLVWELTGSGTWLGAVAVAEFLPTIFVTPIVGALSDRFDRRLLSIIGQVLAGLQAAALCTITALGLVTAELVFALAIFGGVVFPLVQAARLTLVPSLLDKEDITPAIAITAIIFNVTRIVGPAIAGVVIATLGVATAFGLNAASFIAVIFALLALDIKADEGKPAERASLTTDLVDGWRYTLSHPAIGPLMGLGAIACMLPIPVQHLLPGIIDTFYNGGPEMLAAFTSTMGAAALLTGLWMAQRSGVQGMTIVTLVAVLGCGVFTVAFAATNTLWLAYGLIGVLGLFGSVIGVTSQTLVQTAVDEAYRGRAISVWYTAVNGGQALGALVLGAFAEVYGFDWPLIAGGIITGLWALALLPKRGRYAALLEKT